MMASPESIHIQNEGPRPLIRDIPPGAAYPMEALGPLRPMVAAVQDISQAPQAIAAQSALAAAALAVQGHANVETLGGEAPCSLFCMTIAESGERKSTCDRLVLQGLRAYEQQLDFEYRSDQVSHDLKQKTWAEKRKRMIADTASGKKEKVTAAEADLRALGVEPRLPLSPNVTAKDPTFEGLLKLYQCGRPSLGVFSDEGGSFVGGHAMNTDNRVKTMSGLSQLWNGDPVDRTRAGDGATTYRGRRLVVHLMIQPVVARPLLSDHEASGQGFLARFLITEPNSHIGTRLRRDQDPESRMEVEAFARKLHSTLDLAIPTGENPQELTPRSLPLSAAARELLWLYHDEVERAQASGGALEQVRAFGSKATEQAARIAGVLTLWGNLGAFEVTPEAMGWGIDLSQYYLREAKRLIDAGNISPETRRAELLRKWLMDSWSHREILPSEILRRGPNQLRDNKVMRDPLALLEKHGWLEALSEGTVVRGLARKEAYQIIRPHHAV
jgi:hypothetical protein